MNDEPKKLPRQKWPDDKAREAETRRTSRLLDAESETSHDEDPDDPELADVYGMPTDDHGEAVPVYGAPPPDEEPIDVEAPLAAKPSRLVLVALATVIGLTAWWLWKALS